MTNYLVTRHKGAIDWVKHNGIEVDIVLEHFGPQQLDQLSKVDVVIGTLPLQLAAIVCEIGAKYYHLTIDIPLDMRGRELTAEVMQELDARLEQYSIAKVQNRT